MCSDIWKWLPCTLLSELFFSNSISAHHSNLTVALPCPVSQIQIPQLVFYSTPQALSLHFSLSSDWWWWLLAEFLQGPHMTWHVLILTNLISFLSGSLCFSHTGGRSFCSLKTSSLFLPQGLCPRCSFFLQCSSPRFFFKKSWLLFITQVSVQLSILREAIPESPVTSNHIISLPFHH